MKTFKISQFRKPEAPKKNIIAKFLDPDFSSNSFEITAGELDLGNDTEFAVTNDHGFTIVCRLASYATAAGIKWFTCPDYLLTIAVKP